MRKTIVLAVLGLLSALAFVPGTAQAGVATAGAVLLDPFDPVPEIQFNHFGGYGCAYECGGGGYDRCGGGCGDNRCHDDCHRHRRCDDGCHHRDRCDDGCERSDRCDDRCGDRHAHCDQDCDTGDTPYANRTGYAAAPCDRRCSDSEHWEHHWRNGDHVGQEYFDRGRRERDLQTGSGAPSWYGRSPDWHDNDDDDAPPAAAPPAASPPAK